jgi:hypothetical protein
MMKMKSKTKSGAPTLKGGENVESEKEKKREGK